MLGATLPGDIPNIVPVLIEDEGRVGLGDPPGALFDLMFKLVPSPASVAEGDEDLCRASLVADVLQDRDARRNRKAIRDGDGLRPMVIGTVYHEADFRLDRAARKDAHAAVTSPSFWPSALKTLASGCSPIGLLMTIPMAPPGPCSTIKMTARWKRGSPIQGAATSNWPASEG